jgi:hypothetical protein
MCAKHTLERRFLAPATSDFPSFETNVAARFEKSEKND